MSWCKKHEPKQHFGSIITTMYDSAEKNDISNWSEEDHEGEAL